MPTRRELLSLALLAGIPSLPAFAQADYPNKPVRFVVNFVAGGTVDAVTRTVARKLQERFDQPFVIEIRAGANGSIGAQTVVASPADGYTMLGSPPGPLSINQYLYKDSTLDPDKLVPVVLMADSSNVISVRAGLPVNSVAELIAYAKAHPGHLTYASQGNGSTSHLSAQMFANMVGVEMIHIPFKGEAPALLEVLTGRVDLFFGNITAVLRHRESQKVKLLAVASKKRSSMAPDVPTSAESGLRDFTSSAWFSLSAPAGTPPAVIAKINAAVNDILKMPDVVAQFATFGAEPLGGTPADMQAQIDAERRRWKQVISSLKLSLD